MRFVGVRISGLGCWGFGLIVEDLGFRLPFTVAGSYGLRVRIVASELRLTDDELEFRFCIWVPGCWINVWDFGCGVVWVQSIKGRKRLRVRSWVWGSGLTLNAKNL